MPKLLMLISKHWKALGLVLISLILIYVLLHVLFNDRLEVDAAIKEAEKQGLSPSFSDLEFQSFAASIHEALRYSYFDNDSDAVMDILMRMQNDLDVYKLIEIYGTRSESAFGIPLSPKSLPVIVRQDLSQSEIDEINQDYAQKAIQYQF